MNKKLLPLLTLLLFTILVSAQEVTTKQLHLITKRTADWCPKCGDYGWTLFKNLEQKLAKDKALVWALHHSGNLTTPTSTALDDSIFGGFGQPIFWLDDADLMVDADNIKDVEQLVLDVVNSGLFGDAYIGVGMEMGRNNDNTINVSAAVKTFERIEGNAYKLGLYLVNDSLVAFQQNVGLDAVHTGVITKSLISEPLGASVFTAPIEKNTEAKFTWENIVLDLPENADQTKFRVAAILWATDSGGTTRFFNGKVLNLASAIGTSNKDISLIDEIKVHLNADRDRLIIESGDDINEIVRTGIFNAVGMSVKHILNKQGSRNGSIDFMESLTPGIYYFKVTGKKGEITYPFAAY